MALAFPGDHAVVILGEKPNVKKLGELSSTSLGKESFVIDVWSGICCSSKEFPDKFRDKMNKWSEEGKMVIVKTRDGATKIDPGNSDYFENVMSSNLVLKRKYRSDAAVVNSGPSSSVKGA